MVIKWNRNAVKQLLAAILFIEENGFASYAKELEDNILSRIRTLPKTPELYTLDKYRKDNDGSYYAFETHHYRISYRVRKNEIRIIRIRHASRKVLKY